jgi:hypothetical protein
MIRPSDVAQLAIDLGKATFDNFYVSVTTLQTMAEDRAAALVRDTCPASCPLPAIVDAWIGLLRRTRADLKATVDHCLALASGDVTPTSRAPRSIPDSLAPFEIGGMAAAGGSRAH